MSALHHYIVPMLIGLFVSQIPDGSRPVNPPEKPAAKDAQKKGSELGKHLWVCRVELPGKEPQDYVILLPPNETFAHGLIPEAIVGVITRPLKEGERIKPENFARNKIFNDFMHECIARQGPKTEGLQAEARRQGEGWVYILDARTPAPQGTVPPRDIIGAFEVKAGRIVAQSYKRNQNHVLLSQDGFFGLHPDLHKELLKELTARNSKNKK